MAGRRGKGRRTISWRRVRAWNWRRIALAAFLGVSFGLGFYLAQLYGEISELIEERSAGLTSAIYSAPLEIRRGDEIAQLKLLDRLCHLSYTSTAHVIAPGQYSQRPGTITIYFRAVDLGARTIAPTLVHLTLNGSTLVGIADAYGIAMDEATLEPEVIGRLYIGAPAQRVEVQLSELKPFLVNSIIATEDRFFYYHFGLDPIRIVKAAFADWRSGRLAQGASTITQQLARTFMGERTRSFRRKFRELAVAFVIEIRLSKHQILERYVNDVPMGAYDGTPINGLPLAARYLFNKDLSEVTPAEAATLIGMIQAPTLYDPRRHLEAARTRRDVVLGVMRRAGVIDPAAYAEASASPIRVAMSPGLRRAPYFDDYVTGQVEKMPGVGGSLRGLRVYTTLDPVIEAAAQDSVIENLQRIERLHPALRRRDPLERLQSSLVAIDLSTGAIRALVGGRDYAVSQFNRAAQAQRQAGSAFKPLVYLAALDPSRSPLAERVTLASLLPDRPMSFGGWTPANYEHTYQGVVTVVDALAKSLNVPTVYLGSLLGARTMVRTAHELGINGKLPAVLPIAIGAGDTTLLELTSTYQVFASNGMARPPYAIETVVGEHNHVIYRHERIERRLLAPAVAYLMTAALESALRYGTGASAGQLGVTFPAAGKTGTTEDYRDAYLVGYTPALVAGVWVGFDHPQSIGLTGAGAALPTWSHFMAGVAPRGKNFAVPSGITFATIDPASGGLATSACPRTLTLPFLTDTQPTNLCPLHAGLAASAPTLAANGAAPGLASPAASGAPPGSSAPVPQTEGFLAGVGRFFGSLFGGN